MIIQNDLELEKDTSSHFEFTDGGPLVLLDGDPVAYSSAAACDMATHKILINGCEVVDYQGGVTDMYNALGLKDYREFNSLLENNPSITYEKVVESDDPDNMNHTIKAQIKKIIKNTGAGSIRIFLTDGDTNFRITEEIATILKYKGNRSADAKPQLLSEARQYMIDTLGAELVSGMEADDAISIEHRKEWDRAVEEAKDFYLGEKAVLVTEDIEKKAMELANTILVTIDKDMKMCAGKYMNPDDDLGVEEIYPLGHLHMGGKEGKDLKFTGLKGFYAQILKGDDCDNIPNVYFAGDKRVYEVLKDCNTEEELFKATLKEIYEGFHRENIKNLGPVIDQRLEDAISSGKYGNDNKSNRTKVKKKIKDKLTTTVQYCDKHYVHWKHFKLKDDGTVSKELDMDTNPEVSTITPLEFLIQNARLVYMLDTPPDENGSHLWQIPNTEWAKEVIQEYEVDNLLRIPMVGSVM